MAVDSVCWSPMALMTYGGGVTVPDTEIPVRVGEPGIGHDAYLTNLDRLGARIPEFLNGIEHGRCGDLALRIGDPQRDSGSARGDRASEHPQRIQSLLSGAGGFLGPS